jgi:ADP-heptose:LPS heptosyltransferase
MRPGETFLKLACVLHRAWRRQHPRPDTPRVLAIVSNTALGDTLLSTPVVASARASFPDARILFLVHPRYEALFAGLPGVDALLTYDGGYRQLLPTVAALRRQRVDTVLLAHSNGPQDIALGCLSNAATLLKPATRSPLAGFLTTRMPPEERHVIEARCALVRQLGGQRIHTRMILPPRYFGDLPPQFPRLPLPAIGFQLGAANHYKMWPLKNFAALARQLLARRPEAHIVLTGSPAERALAHSLIASVQDARIVDHTGKHAVEDLPWLLRQLSVLVTNDTGPMHLAIALGIPTVCLFGMTSSRLIGPYQDPDKHIVLQSPLEGAELHLPKKQRSNRAMTAISVDAVAAAVCKLLEMHHAHPAHH